MSLDWSACRNARNLGGLPTADGGRIRAGALRRCGRGCASRPSMPTGRQASSQSSLPPTTVRRDFINRLPYRMA